MQVAVPNVGIAVAANVTMLAPRRILEQLSGTALPPGQGRDGNDRRWHLGLGRSVPGAMEQRPISPVCSPDDRTGATGWLLGHHLPVLLRGAE